MENHRKVKKILKAHEKNVKDISKALERVEVTVDDANTQMNELVNQNNACTTNSNRQPESFSWIALGCLLTMIFISAILGSMVYVGTLEFEVPTPQVFHHHEQPIEITEVNNFPVPQGADNCIRVTSLDENGIPINQDQYELRCSTS